MSFKSKDRTAQGWSEIDSFTLSPAGQREIGQFMVEAVKQEAMKDIARIGQLPNTAGFLNSFTWEVKGGQLFLTTDWPQIEMYVEGRKAYPMTWLTQEKGVYKIPLIKPDGTVIIRSAPLTTADAWIHPAIAKHTFVQRALDRSYAKMKEVIGDELLKILLAGDPSK